VHVFEIKPLAAEPGGIVEEVDGIAHGVAVQLTDQGAGAGGGAEQAGANAGGIGLHFLDGAFVVRQFQNETQQQRVVLGPRITDTQTHALASPFQASVACSCTTSPTMSSVGAFTSLAATMPGRVARLPVS